MGLATSVSLHKDARPVFPDRCVVCAATGPTARVRFRGLGAGGALSLFVPGFWIFTKSRVYEAPACAGCKGRFVRQRWLRIVLTWVLVLVAVGLVYPYVSHFAFVPRRLAAAALALVVLAPWIVFEVFFPRYLDITVHADRVELDFASRPVAVAFREANEGAVVASDLDRDT